MLGLKSSHSKIILIFTVLQIEKCWMSGVSRRINEKFVVYVDNDMLDSWNVSGRQSNYAQKTIK